ncbi:glycosyltransferase family 2 protein [Flavivirga jejuensis]|uniref:Glycosyltransferase family 2 protein n=1 Tax=Flavivirga jejuensis TaxID=870487 RepID=A0ABT8WU05_9FLAO|nr:glycosyltransferase family 2 protein [Flavivirga jejuensis]MDO5976672.1 glycosyltransferase family 2 protein [Flavivirga jejuensis]
MLNNLLISIITVNYNNVDGLETTIKSVQNQDFINFEHIIIDGNSIDGSKELIEANKASFSYWISEPDKGIYHAMNKGIKVAKGDYLFFLNSGDDLTDSQALTRVKIHLNEYDIVYFNINDVGLNETRVKKCPEVLTFAFLHEDLPPHQSTFIKKSLFEKIGYYDERLKIVSDWKFLILALCKFNATYKYIDDVFSNFYRGGLSSLEENFEIVKAERTSVLNTEFSIQMNDLKYKFKLERILRNLRKSKKMQILIKLGLINKF